jgi:hypothetical protein
MSGEGDAAAGLLNVLGSDAAAVRRAGFAGLLRTGGPVLGPELAAATGLTSARVDVALRTLVGAGAATVDAGDALVATGGLSVVRTTHRLSLGRLGFFTRLRRDRHPGGPGTGRGRVDGLRGLRRDPSRRDQQW